MFSIQIKTLRELVTDSDQQRECLQFSVINNETGEETLVENMSGGEQALVKEVISLGLSIFQRNRTGHQSQTLIRDEATAPLSEANTERYINMLRRAVKMGGFKQAIFVSHKGVAQQMADAKIVIKNGTTKVEAA